MSQLSSPRRGVRGNPKLVANAQETKSKTVLYDNQVIAVRRPDAPRPTSSISFVQKRLYWPEEL